MQRIYRKVYIFKEYMPFPKFLSYYVQERDGSHRSCCSTQGTQVKPVITFALVEHVGETYKIFL